MPHLMARNFYQNLFSIHQIICQPIKTPNVYCRPVYFLKFSPNLRAAVFDGINILPPNNMGIQTLCSTFSNNRFNCRKCLEILARALEISYSPWTRSMLRGRRPRSVLRGWGANGCTMTTEGGTTWEPRLCQVRRNHHHIYK